MKPYRGNAIAAGVLFLTCTAASVLSAVPLGTTLDGSGYLSRVADNGQGVVVAALIEFVWAATGAGIAIALYPVLRTWHRGLALGSVAGRVAEAMFVLIGTLSLLTLSTVSQEAAKSGAAARSSFQVTADTLLATRDSELRWLVSPRSCDLEFLPDHASAKVVDVW